jgi:phosphoinositide-3-kinase regulatory subunit 4
MIELDPEERPSAKEILNRSRATLFPDEFYTWLVPFSRTFDDPSMYSNAACPGELRYSTSDARILCLWAEHERDAIPETLSSLVVNYVTSCMRTLTYPRTQLLALDILLALASNVTDELRLDRTIPVLCWLFQNAKSPLIRAESIRSLASIVRISHNRVL